MSDTTTDTRGSPTPEQPAAKRRMPTGLKVAIGCIVVFFGFAALAAVVLGVGGFWLKGQADDFVEGVEARAEAQQEASRILERLEEEHPFTPPANGQIDPTSANRYFEATRLAWREIEPAAARMHAVAERDRAGETRLGDVLEGARASGLLIDSRLHIARALEEAGMSLDEYVWTGGALRNAGELDSLESDSGEPSPVIVLGLAQAWSHGRPSASDFIP